MSRKKASTVLKLALVSLILGLIAGGAIFSYNSAEVALKLERLRSQNRALVEQAEHMKFIRDMSIEFSISPRIVELIDEQSRRYVDSTQAEWRLIQTPEFMTHIMLSIIYAESKGDARAVGDRGRARGLTQIWTSTARQYGEVSAKDLLDPAVNIDYSFRHFEYLLQRYRGNLALALYAWNRGQGTIDKLLMYGEPPNNAYAPKVYRAAMAGARSAVKGD